MYSIWTKHLQDQKDKSDFENTVQGSRPVLERISQIIDEDTFVTEQGELNPKVFENANWAYKQAYLIGYKACLNKYKKLINLDQQKDSTTI